MVWVSRLARYTLWKPFDGQNNKCLGELEWLAKFYYEVWKSPSFGQHPRHVQTILVLLYTNILLKISRVDVSSVATWQRSNTSFDFVLRIISWPLVSKRNTGKISLNACQTCSAEKAHNHSISTFLTLFTGECNLDEATVHFACTILRLEQKLRKSFLFRDHTWILVTLRPLRPTFRHRMISWLGVGSLILEIVITWLLSSLNWQEKRRKIKENPD